LKSHKEYTIFASVLHRSEEHRSYSAAVYLSSHGRSGGMKNAEWTPYAAALRAKAAELTAKLNNRDGLLMETEPDVFDQIQNATDRALVIQVLDRSSTLLREVRGAMERMNGGTIHNAPLFLIINLD
jgi:hypothetical protein